MQYDEINEKQHFRKAIKKKTNILRTCKNF